MKPEVTPTMKPDVAPTKPHGMLDVISVFQEKVLGMPDAISVSEEASCFVPGMVVKRIPFAWQHGQSTAPRYSYQSPGSSMTSGASNVLLEDIRKEVQEVKRLLTQHMAAHHKESHMASGVIELRQISDTEARKEILAFFAEQTGDVYYEQICEGLALPLDQVYRICCELEREGLIGEAT